MFAVKCVFILCVVAAASTFDLGDRDVIFHLFTRTNPQVSQALMPSVNSIMASSFSLQRRTIITIHSFGEGVGSNFNAFLVPTHLNAEDVNVLAVDWSPGSGQYSQGLGNAPQCGQVIAQFVDILSSQFSYNVNMIRIVGFGLGGHIAGIAARRINGNIPHIIALDPSLVGWTHNPNRLGPDAAGIVEVLHTTSNPGYDHPLGDIDFYPNGGSAQPGCSNIACAQTYSYAFYAESISTQGNRFVGTKCESYEQAIALQCEGERDAIFGGADVKTSESGIYVFLTNPQSPFARG